MNRLWTWLTKPTTIVLIIGISLLCYGSIVPGYLFLLVGGATAYLMHNQQKNYEAILADLRAKQEQSANDDDGDERDEPESFSFDLTDPHVEKDSGWTNYELFPARLRYTRSSCQDGPPLYKTVYEYSVKEGDSVFQRCLDDWREDVRPQGGTRYDVVNGQVLYKPEWDKPSDEKGLQALKNYPEEHLEELKANVLWHEVKGEVGWLILSRHKPPWSARSYLTKEKKRLQEGFAKLEARMKDLGAHATPVMAAVTIRLRATPKKRAQRSKRHNRTTPYSTATTSNSTKCTTSRPGWLL